MEEIIERLTAIEIKIDALLYALMDEEDEPNGDEYGEERDTDSML